MKYLLSLAFALCSLPSVAAKVAIVIDDIGYHQIDYKLLELPYDLTFAVIPHTTHTAMQSLRPLIRSNVM